MLTAIRYSPRNIGLLSFLSFGGGYSVVKSRTLAEKQRAIGDYSVTVDRSGTSLQLSDAICPIMYNFVSLSKCASGQSLTLSTA
jgi:hypothetical protein